MRRQAQQGFTLIELILALTIVAAMLTVLFGGLRAGLRAWQRGEERAQTLQYGRSMSQLLGQALGGAYAFQGRINANDAQPQILFQGEEEKVSFVTVSPPYPFPVPIAFTAITLSMDTGAAPGLAVREKVLPNFDPFEPLAPNVVDPTIVAIRFRYLRDAEGGAWETVWSGADERALPRAVEVTLTANINGRREERPPITVPIRVTAP